MALVENVNSLRPTSLAWCRVPVAFPLPSRILPVALPLFLPSDTRKSMTRTFLDSSLCNSRLSGRLAPIPANHPAALRSAYSRVPNSRACEAETWRCPTSSQPMEPYDMQRVVGGNGHRRRRCHVYLHERSVCLLAAGPDGMFDQNAVIKQYFDMLHNSMKLLEAIPLTRSQTSRKYQASSSHILKISAYAYVQLLLHHSNCHGKEGG